jgi:hypothetical protein
MHALETRLRRNITSPPLASSTLLITQKARTNTHYPDAFVISRIVESKTNPSARPRARLWRVTWPWLWRVARYWFGFWFERCGRHDLGSSTQRAVIKHRPAIGVCGI